MSEQVMALTADWLNDSTTTTTPWNASNYTSDSMSTTSWTDYNYYYHYPYPWSYTFWEKLEIELNMSDVEHLRKIARKDKKLREVLQKFTPYIKVRVDFPG